MRYTRQIKITVLLVLVALAGTLRAAENDYKKDAMILSQNIIEAANDLKQETSNKVLDTEEIDYLVDDIKSMIKDYESLMVFAESPYPGEILLAKTAPGDDTWIESPCTSR